MTPGASAFFALCERLQHGIVHRLRWRELRPVQEVTIRAVSAGDNVIVLAPTAGGKTEASMFPVLDRLYQERAAAVAALYLSPLRALLNNQEPRLQELAALCGYEAFKWHGDVAAGDKQKFIKNPAHFLMTTPESLEVIMMTERYDQMKLFKNLRYVIIDEIHGFAGDDRGDHLVALLERLAGYSQHDFQRIGLSATVGNPEKLVEWIQGSSRRPGRVVDPGGQKSRRILDILPLPAGQDATATAAVLARGKKSLLFADARSRVEKMQAGLERAGIRAFPHHASLSRELREESEEAFRSGSNCAIVCTSTMELGLDVGDLDQVLQLGAPNTVSAFLQRLGRTGRRPGTTGRMSFLVDDAESFLVACGLIKLALRGWVEPITPSAASYPVFIHQVLARALARSGLSRAQAVAGQGSPYCFSEIRPEERHQIIDKLLETEVLSEVDSRLVLGPRGEKQFGYSNFMRLYSVFDTPPSLKVRSANNKEIGTIESWFVQSSDEALCFLLGGKAWQVANVDWKRGILTVKPAARGKVPTWMGTPRVYTEELCREIRDLLRATDEPAFLGQGGLRYLGVVRGQWRDLVEGDRRLVYRSETDNSVTLYTFAGARINNVIARLHGWRTGQKTVAHNFYVKSTVASGQSYFKQLDETLDAIQSQEFSQELLQGLVAGLSQGRLSKFQPFLPKHLEARFLASRLFDVEGARRLCGAKKAEPTIVQPALVEPREPQAPSTPPAPPPLETPVQAIAATVSIGSLHEPFLRQLAELAQSHTTTNKWVFVPHPGLKWTLAERLCQAGVNWVNFRFLTPFELALELAAPQLLSQGVQPSSEELGPTLVLKLLTELPAATPEHFRPLADQPRMAEALWGTLQELRMAGLGAGDLRERSPRLLEFKALLEAYETHLDQHRTGDRATLFATALADLEHVPIQGHDLVLEFPSATWSPLEREFLDALPGERRASWVVALDTPRRWATLCPHREARPQPGQTDVHRLAYLGDPETPEAGAGDGTLQLFYAGRRDAEVQEVLRRILSGRFALDQVELAAQQPDTIALIWDKCHKHELALTVEEGLPVSASALGRAFLGLLEWIEHSFAAYQLRALLLSQGLEPDGLSGPQAARFLNEAQASWGRETYRVCLKNLQARYHRRAESRRAEDPDRADQYEGQAERVQRLHDWLVELLAQVPALDAQQSIDFGALVAGLEKILLRAIPLQSELDRSSQKAILRSLADLRLLDNRRLPLADALQQLRDKLEVLRTGASRALAGHLHLTRLDRVGLSGRPVTFILGLEEGSLVAAGAQDPVLFDSERQQLRSGLQLASDRSAELVFRVLERLASLDGQITLSFSCRDLRSGDELQPSWLYFRAARLLYSELVDYEGLFEKLGEPVGFAAAHPKNAASELEWWLSMLTGIAAEASDTVRAGFPWLQRGYHAARQRASALFTVFDGLVHGAAGRLDPREEGKPMSVSRLQNLAGCPFQYFLSEALGLSRIAIEPMNTDRWLDAANRGTVLHDVFANYYRRLRQEARRPDLDLDFPLLRDLLEDLLSPLRAELPPPSEAVEAEEIRALHRDLDRFLRLEAAAQNRSPMAFEVGFGLPELFDEPLATREPVNLDLGQGLSFALRGRIDRIDQVGGAFEVVDYKSGAYLASRRDVRYDGGRLLQHALYTLVAERLLQQAVTRSSYYFPVAGAKHDWLSFEYPDIDELRRVVQDVLEPLSSGAFAHAPDPDKDCKFCDFRAACSAHNKQHFKAKLENSDNAVLECRRRLKGVK